MVFMPSPVKGRERMIKSTETGQHSETGEDPFRAADIAVATFVMDVAERNFPGLPWMVEADSAHGIASIRLPHQMNHWQYTWKIEHLQQVDGPKYVIRGCGEVAERWGLPTSGRAPHKDELVNAPVINGPNAQLPN